jgi:LAO/AO transport system kinase
LSKTDSNNSINPRFSRPPASRPDLETLRKGVLAGNIYLLSQAITLIESTAERDREPASTLLSSILPFTGASMRLGVSGTPGVGKSTFIEHYGKRIADRGEKLAVLAVDPSSQQSKGSILGDKTRMEQLARLPNVFIRPSPSGNRFGGVARKTSACILLCEAAGFNHILVETVGIGQSETEVHKMVDLFLLLLLPGGGDELQGIKRGIMELADIILINKADGNRLEQAQQTRKEYANSIQLMQPSRPHWKTKVQILSALEGLGFDNLEASIKLYFEAAAAVEYIETLRRSQAMHWMHEQIRQQLQSSFYQTPAIKAILLEMEAEVRAGSISSHEAANKLMNLYLSR